jgi:hypothetical protein
MVGRRFFLGGVLVTLMACSTAPPAASETEETATVSSELSASSLRVDASPLVNRGAVITLRLFGPSANGFVIGWQGRVITEPLPPLVDGSYVIADYLRTTPYGSFEVASGQVVATTGALTITPTGLGFDLTKLAAITVPTGALTEPRGLFDSLRIVTPGDTALTSFGSDFTVYVPDGTFGITDYAQTRTFGTFTVSGQTVVSTTGGVSQSPTGIVFDPNKLARVAIPAAGLSSPAALTLLRFPSMSGAFKGDIAAYLPSGSYEITDYTAEHALGSFVVEGTAVTSATGAFVPTTGGVGFDKGKLAEVRVPSAALSEPAALFTTRLGSYSDRFNVDATFWLPAGRYSVVDGGDEHSYGTFDVSGTSISAVNGGLARSSSGIAYDASKLAWVTLPLNGLSSPEGYVVGRAPATAPFGGNPRAADVRLLLAPGHYTVTDQSGSTGYGSFRVTGPQVTSATGVFAPDADRGLRVNRCGAPGVEVVTTAAGFAALVNVTTWFRGNMRLTLPAARYEFRDRPGTGFSLGADGTITNSVLPPEVVSVRRSPCVVPPTVSCVGSASAPVELSGACSVSVDATNGLAGTCSGGGGGLASCTFDGASVRELGPGTHAVSVVGTAADGSTSTCTSYVRVRPCPIPPKVSCVGTASGPARLASPANACGVTVDAENALAGTCGDAGSGVAACTFQGATRQALGVGDHAVEVVGVSSDGSVARCTSYVRVEDVTPPSLTCPTARRVECTGPRTRLSATASCSDACGACSATCASASAPVGTTSLACSGSDATGNLSRCEAPVTVVDTRAPRLSLRVSPTVLWPPNQQLIPISLSTTAVDTCDPSPSVTCAASSNEAPLSKSSGQTTPDIVWSKGKLFLRAERNGRGSGRTYKVTCTSRDASGNASVATATVSVPHSRSCR